MSRGKYLQMFVIYEDPKDYPGQFVVRRWLGLEPDPKPLMVTDDLIKARASIPEYCTMLGRFTDDDPAIKEVWI